MSTLLTGGCVRNIEVQADSTLLANRLSSAGIKQKSSRPEETRSVKRHVGGIRPANWRKYPPQISDSSSELMGSQPCVKIQGLNIARNSGRDLIRFDGRCQAAGERAAMSYSSAALKALKGVESVSRKSICRASCEREMTDCHVLQTRLPRKREWKSRCGTIEKRMSGNSNA